MNEKDCNDALTLPTDAPNTDGLIFNCDDSGMF